MLFHVRRRPAQPMRLRRLVLSGDLLEEGDPCKPTLRAEEPWVPQTLFSNSGTVGGH